MGVAENNMLLIACGLEESLSRRVYCYSISPFVTLRTFEVIRNFISNDSRNIRIIGVGSGVSYAEMEEKGFMLPVVSAELEYKAPVLYDEEIRIDLELFDVPGIRLNTYYKVYSVKTGQLKTRGKVVLVFMDATTRRPVRAPESFINSLNYALRTS